MIVSKRDVAVKKLGKAKPQTKRGRQQIKKRQVENKSQLMGGSSSVESGRNWSNASFDKEEKGAEVEIIAEEDESGENEKMWKS